MPTSMQMEEIPESNPAANPFNWFLYAESLMSLEKRSKRTVSGAWYMAPRTYEMCVCEDSISLGGQKNVPVEEVKKRIEHYDKLPFYKKIFAALTTPILKLKDLYLYHQQRYTAPSLFPMYESKAASWNEKVKRAVSLRLVTPKDALQYSSKRKMDKAETKRAEQVQYAFEKLSKESETISSYYKKRYVGYAVDKDLQAKRDFQKSTFQGQLSSFCKAVTDYYSPDKWSHEPKTLTVVENVTNFFLETYNQAIGKINAAIKIGESHDYTAEIKKLREELRIAKMSPAEKEDYLWKQELEDIRQYKAKIASQNTSNNLPTSSNNVENAALKENITTHPKAFEKKAVNAPIKGDFWTKEEERPQAKDLEDLPSPPISNDTIKEPLQPPKP